MAKAVTAAASQLSATLPRHSIRVESRDRGDDRGDEILITPHDHHEVFVEPPAYPGAPARIHVRPKTYFGNVSED